MTASGASVTFDPSNPRQRIAFPNKSLRLTNACELIKTRQKWKAFVPEQACGQEKESNCEVIVESKYAVVDLCSTKKGVISEDGAIDFLPTFALSVGLVWKKERNPTTAPKSFVIFAQTLLHHWFY